MATFSVTGVSAACGFSNTAYAISYLYSIGSILYSCPNARKGKLESVAIKKILPRSGYVLYVDTFNRIWNENDLCEEANARELVITYWETLEAELLEELLNCGN